MKIVYYEPSYGIFSGVAHDLKDDSEVSEIEDIAELADIGSLDLLLINPGPNFNEGWNNVASYAKSHPETKVLVNAIGVFENIEQTRNRVGNSNNIEVLGFHDTFPRLRDIIDDHNN